MDVLLVYHKESNTVVAVLEYAGELALDNIKGKWLASIGMTVAAANDFRIDYAPVVLAKHWQKFEPIYG